ncbi:PDR/VanB family oxidoreductase [Bacillus songklensis]|uniref:PDR/VanB family oxidoreductase n=1 Tax=Bacillus songklensis TaxID=1069116 RepID=A0ABV8B525_9BACI
MYKEKTIPVYVKSIHKETPLVKCFTLAPVDGTVLPAFSGGSHITAYIEGSDGLIERQYSLTNHPDHTGGYQIAIRLSDTSKGGSLYWHHHVKVGDKLQISYPKNHFPLSFKAKHHVFYAGGIGITPFLSMMAELKDRGASFELHYASKSREFCAFYNFLKENYSKQCYFYFSQERKSKRISKSTLLHHSIGTHVYFCGTESFISNFTEAALELGYPSSSVHFERFTPPQPKKLAPFQVKLTNGVTVNVSKEHTLLEALLEAGIKAPYSCRVGRCGTCELKVIEGTIDHYDSFLSEEQKNSQGVILTCVSRAKSDKLVIDF